MSGSRKRALSFIPESLYLESREGHQNAVAQEPKYPMRNTGVSGCKQHSAVMNQCGNQQTCRKTYMATVFVQPIRFYRRFISPLFPRSCRFYPTCSQYAQQALERYGTCKGIWLTLKRLSKCHPYHPGGFDPLK